MPYYERDGITIFHADAREMLPGIEDDSVDLVLTDPPYGHHQNNGDLAHKREAALGLVSRGIAAEGDARPIANDDRETANALVRWLFAESRRILKPGCCCCCCGGGGGPDPQFARWSMWMDEALGFKQAVVWDKGGLGLGWHYRRNYELVLVGQKPGAPCKWYGGSATANVVRMHGIKPGADDHPTPKPVALMAWFMRLHSAIGDLVLDPFAGGGSTLAAAKLMRRKAVGIEIDERWCEMAARRVDREQACMDFACVGPMEQQELSWRGG